MIYIQPIGLRDTQILEATAEGVHQAFGFAVKVCDGMPVPAYALNDARGQYHSTAILRNLHENVPYDALRVLAVTDVDLFVPQLNFVFGEAAIDGLVCIISLRRLRPEFYGAVRDDDLFSERVVKEAIHELGHTFGLRHSDDPRCVMHFSNTIWDTDYKSTSFCREDDAELRAKLRCLRRAA